MSNTISILGCGWLGMPLGKRLVQAGYRVKGSTTRAEKTEQIAEAGMTPSVIRFTPQPEGDISDFMATDTLFINIPPGKGDGQPQFYLRQMTELVRQIESASIKKVIFISATSVYPQKNKTVTEEDAIHIISPFSDTAWLDIERLFTENKHFKTTVLRFSGLIGGDYQPGRYFSGRELGGANDPVNMIHQEDCIQIVEAIIKQDKFGEIFNASADGHPSRRELYTRSCKLMDIDLPLFSDAPRAYRIVNCDKLKKQLDYQFVYPDPVAALDQ